MQASRNYIFFALVVVSLSLYFYFAAANKKEALASLTSAIELSSPIQLESVYEKGFPVQMLIPKIKLSALIEEVGFTSTGAMDTPKNRENVGWFAPGVNPGEIGSSVIAGHYGWKNKKASAFDHLSELKVGDLVYVVNNKHATTTFIVRSIKRVDPKEDPTSIFRSSDNIAHLNLITCDGIWDKNEKSYSKRLVIFTEKVI